MASSLNFEEGQSTYRPPRFNGQYYGWWKTKMHDFIMAEDSELWDVICDGPFVLMKTIKEPAVTVPKCRKEYSDADHKAIEKNFRAKKIHVFGIRPDEYNRISACQSAKEIWEAFQTAHEGTTQIKQSKIDMLTTEYELFRMKDDESIQDMHTRFTSIINELHSLGEIIPRNKLVRKILSVLLGSWESKVNAITEAKDLQKLTIDELIGNLKTYEMKKKKDHERREPKREKNLVLKTDNNESSDEDVDMAYLTKRFQKMVRKNRDIPKKGSSSKPRGYDLCHKCGKPGHFIKDYPLLKQDQYKHNIDKTTKRNSVPDKRFKRKEAADNVVKQALAAWGDSSSEFGEDDAQADTSMIAVESEAADYDSISALMAKSDDDENNDNDEKKLISLGNILIDAYHNLINDKNALIRELGEVENERDDLVVVVADLKETIENLVKEKSVLIKKAENIENERYDLLVVIMDLKETIEELKKENSSRTVQKEKEVTSEAYIKLENELQSVKSSLCVELERNRQLQEDLGRVKNDLEKSLKWTCKYVTVPDNWLCTHCGNAGHFKENCKATIQSQQKNKVFVEKETTAKNLGAVKGSSQKWYMDSGCSKHMTGSINDFLSLKALQEGSVSFGNGKRGYILGVGRIGKSLTHSIENVYYVNGLKYSLLSVSQIYDKGNNVEFMSKVCTITNLVTGEVVLVAKRYKNIYVADFESLQNGDLTCLSVVDDDDELWHRRLGHASLTLLNKLVSKDLVHGMLMSSFKNHKVCDECVKEKQVRSSFKPKRMLAPQGHSISSIWICGPMRVSSRGGKKYIFVIVDDYSRFTWTLFLKTKDETFPVFVAFVKKIQIKVSHNVACIRSDHGIEFDNAKFDKLCVENGISHNFSTPRTPQQNGVMERKNRTLEDMTRTMLIDSGTAKNFWAEAVNTVCYLVNSDEGIFLGYSSQSKAYKVYNKRTQCVEESIHVIFDESHHLHGKDSYNKIDQVEEKSIVPGEVIDMANGKADMMSYVKESNDDDAAVSPADAAEPSSSITITEAKNRVVDVVKGTLDAKLRSGTHINHGSHSEVPGLSHNEIRVSNWKHKISHPLQNVITPLDSGIQTRSKSRKSLAFSALLSQVEPKNIKKALKDIDWITAMQDKLHQFERNSV
ncbi:uncharacterized protein [Nicotiana tomentosiformis]|uniref:uncharacterized protein n=1 Tax=Nicotiana tomentosiformis TaxID=4098 RepID=UPI00388C6AD8